MSIPRQSTISSALLRLVAIPSLCAPHLLPSSIAIFIPFLYLYYFFEWLRNTTTPVVEVREVIREIDVNKRKIRRLEEIKELQVRRDGEVSEESTELILGRPSPRTASGAVTRASCYWISDIQPFIEFRIAIDQYSSRLDLPRRGVVYEIFLSKGRSDLC
jgi:hypothetical protein